MAKQIGVKIFFKQELGKHFTVDSLKNDGYEAVFIGAGLTDAKKLKDAIYDEKNNIWSSKSFLPPVNYATKMNQTEKLPKLSGHVIVLGIGDTALDCARSA